MFEHTLHRAGRIVEKFQAMAKILASDRGEHRPSPRSVGTSCWSRRLVVFVSVQADYIDYTARAKPQISSFILPMVSNFMHKRHCDSVYMAKLVQGRYLTLRNGHVQLRLRYMYFLLKNDFWNICVAIHDNCGQVGQNLDECAQSPAYTHNYKNRTNEMGPAVDLRI